MLDRLTGMVAEVGLSILAILGLLLFFQVVVFRTPLTRWSDVVLGLFFVACGLVALLYGLRLGIGPLGESVSNSLVRTGRSELVLAFAFLMGLTVTYAEPALLVIAEQVARLTGGAMGRGLFLGTVACGVAGGMVIGTTRILYGIPATDYFIPFLAVLLVLTYFAPERYTALAFDAALATTGPLTVTLVIALGNGLAMASGRTETLLYGFGLVTMAAIGPIVAVLGLGIILGVLEH